MCLKKLDEKYPLTDEEKVRWFILKKFHDWYHNHGIKISHCTYVVNDEEHERAFLYDG